MPSVITDATWAKLIPYLASRTIWVRVHGAILRAAPGLVASAIRVPRPEATW